MKYALLEDVKIMQGEKSGITCENCAAVDRYRRHCPPCTKMTVAEKVLIVPVRCDTSISSPEGTIGFPAIDGKICSADSSRVRTDVQLPSPFPFQLTPDHSHCIRRGAGAH